MMYQIRFFGGFFDLISPLSIELFESSIAILYDRSSVFVPTKLKYGKISLQEGEYQFKRYCQ